ncbi:hypothetical protein D0X99_12670 [Algoriphagus lacus]|uniref:Uncharacterized protein n=1 Tax=Algoriphagus lacus TaxID=2056311 RepID=A0A418PQ30_9BACT|nr:hypothetical protein D0X99_12670 [Algoriphagus lacus]
MVNGRIPVISFTGWGCIKLPLKRNDGNDAACAHAEQLLKIQYFYWCFPFTLAKIGTEREQANLKLVSK